MTKGKQLTMHEAQTMFIADDKGDIQIVSVQSPVTEYLYSQPTMGDVPALTLHDMIKLKAWTKAIGIEFWDKV